MFNLKKILLIASCLTIGGFSNVNGYVSDLDVLRYQSYAEHDAKSNNYKDQKRHRIENRIEELKKEMDRTNSKILDLETKIKEKKSEQESLDYEYAMCVAKKDIATSDRDRSDINRKMRSLKSKINLVMKKLNNLQIMLDRAKSKLGRQKALIYNFEQELKDIR